MNIDFVKIPSLSLFSTSQINAAADLLLLVDVDDTSGDPLGTPKTVTINSIAPKIPHDLLQGYSANRHIDHSAVSITAGTALTGGGTIAATRTLNVNLSGLTGILTEDLTSADLLLVQTNGDGIPKKIPLSELYDYIWSVFAGLTYDATLDGWRVNTSEGERFIPAYGVPS